MKNNQFKKIIRTFIDDLCEENNYTAVNVDKTNSTRLTYIYNPSYFIILFVLFEHYFFSNFVFCYIFVTPSLCKCSLLKKSHFLTKNIQPDA